MLKIQHKTEEFDKPLIFLISKICVCKNHNL